MAIQKPPMESGTLIKDTIEQLDLLRQMLKKLQVNLEEAEKVTEDTQKALGDNLPPSPENLAK